MSLAMFVTDLDNTLAGGDISALQKLNRRLEMLRQRWGTKIVYATGRSQPSYFPLAAECDLLTPDALVAAVGTEIYLEAGDTPLAAWEGILRQSWRREEIVEVASQFPELTLQPPAGQQEFKISYFLTVPDAATIVSDLQDRLKLAGHEVEAIYSRQHDLDILPRNSQKGDAIAFLLNYWQIAARETIVCGDSGNDISLFARTGANGILVGNAAPELRSWYESNPSDNLYLALSTFAAGIDEGLDYFQVDRDDRV